MSFMDNKLIFWDAQALTADEESRTNGNIIDLEASGAADAMLGDVYFNLRVATTFTGMASGGYFALNTSDSATFASGVQTIGAIGSANAPLTTTELVAGKGFSIAVPLRICHRYVEARWEAVSENATAGAVDAWLGMEPIVDDLTVQKEPS